MIHCEREDLGRFGKFGATVSEVYESIRVRTAKIFSQFLGIITRACYQIVCDPQIGSTFVHHVSHQLFEPKTKICYNLVHTEPIVIRIDGTSCHCLASTGRSYIHNFTPDRNLKTIQKLGLNRELYACNVPAGSTHGVWNAGVAGWAPSWVYHARGSWQIVRHLKYEEVGGGSRGVGWVRRLVQSAVRTQELAGPAGDGKWEGRGKHNKGCK